METSTPTCHAIRCDMQRDCTAPIAYVDRKGYVYCIVHGVSMKFNRPCRKLTAGELRTLQAGETIKY